MDERFLMVIVVIGLIMLIWDCIEVGRNDAANLVNAVFGSRVLARNTAVMVAGVAVILGATFASPVMETARKGIFNPALLTVQAAMVVYITAYIVDTVLLHTYSAFGMPVSTTASLVFELVGASAAVAWLSGVGQQVVHWDKVGTVISAIVISILISGIAGWMMQRMFRGAIRQQPPAPLQVMQHGPWIAGLMFSGLSWFLIIKGLKHVSFIKKMKEATLDEVGPVVMLLLMWAAYTLIIHLWLRFSQEKGVRNLFRITAIAGMICLSFAFGQNDLANCASPGLSSLWLYQNMEAGTAAATKITIPMWALFACGVLMVVGMGSKNAQRVTRAAVNTGSQYDHVALYAPKWCRRIATLFVKNHDPETELAPPPQRDDDGKRVHFDPLRASVIMSVSASVIALASSSGIPVSTTYVTFACVIATGMADGVMSRGDADRKIGRAIWTVFSWFAGALIAMLAAGAVAAVIYKFGYFGLFIGLGGNFLLRILVSRRSAEHEMTFHKNVPKV
ncbi:MAG: inorganic phosphate transporter [Kiritimatiellia bacterium]